MAEEYSHYLRNPVKTDNGKCLCQCINEQSFGKNCEYLLPKGTTVQETVEGEIDEKNTYTRELEMYSHILCYTTLICNSGLLCLDWRDICDGFQQCMFGYDEENCDKLEFNECEDDEYRCLNGMCIPQEYFLDGEYDCLDLTDEKQFFNDLICTLEIASHLCDDRICLPRTWSCGDGQCIDDRLSFQTDDFIQNECISQRDQYFICETHSQRPQWTLPNGKCHAWNPENPLNIANESLLDDCEYIIKCALSYGSEKNCPCGKDMTCINELEIPCNSTIIQYPKGGIITPYIFYFYNKTRDWSDTTPDLILLNGTIKCRGYMITQLLTIPYSSDFHLNTIEDFLCDSISSGSIEMNIGYDQFCYNNSRTFNNRSYHFLDVCNYSKECISAYRIGDGYKNCVDEMDEKQDEIISETCFSIKNFRFRCSVEEMTCLTVNHLGNQLSDCKNDNDESSLSTGNLLSKMNCNEKSKGDCQFLRQYIQSSWNIDNNTTREFKSTKSIPFRTYCDTFWDLGANVDENVTMCRTWWICHEEQWQCHTGQCISRQWILDGQWDCSDASDEEGIFASKSTFSLHNLKIINISQIEEMINTSDTNTPLSKICDSKNEFPCLRIDVSSYANSSTHDQLCINVKQIGDGIVDCIGGIDERNTIEYCNHVDMLGNNYKCLTSDTCISYSKLCNIRCPNKSDDDILCFGQNQMKNCSESPTDFMCLNGHCAKNGRCNYEHDCLYGEDEYLCIYQNDYNIERNVRYRRQKEDPAISNKYDLQLPNLPVEINENQTIVQNSSTKQTKLMVIDSLDFNSLVSVVCNRGIGILLYNGSIICFCPPQYYGDKCQFHSDRITVILQLNFSQSTYERSTDPTIVLKLLVLFLFKNQTLMSYEFHTRPVIEMTISSKKIDYLLYSRSHQSLHDKRMRYFNRSNIINDHPYSIRIESYELKTDKKPQLIAIWEYPLYFDYLPNFRLAKILRFTKLDLQRNSCLSNPCSPPKQCQQLLNHNSTYVCLCPNNYRENDCLTYDQMCSDGFCSSNALCKPDYRSLLQGNERPYCLCPLNTYGRRCELKYDQCNSNPCQNNGSCFPTALSNEYFCVCNSFYQGIHCDLRKELMNFFINETVEHKGVVVQYFCINIFPHDLVLINQRSFYNVPYHLEYFQEKLSASGLIFVKLYSGTQVGIYLISIYNTIKSFNMTIQINENIRCVDVYTLFARDNEISLFKYHHLCRNNTSLLCFFDPTYLCICTKNHFRAECFIYDQSLDHCSRCFANGSCLKGDQFQENDFICICPKCHYGHLCQFSSEQLSFTLDSLLIQNYFSIQLFYLILTLLIFFIGGITNYASFITFKRPNPRKTAVGNYLLILSILNQCSLLSLFLKITHILFGSLSGNIPCKVITYLLSITTRYSYWLTSWITIDRVRLTLFPFRIIRNKKSHSSMIISLITLLIIGGMHVHELLFYISLRDSSEQIVCVIPITGKISLYNRVTIVIHYIVPFCIQIVSITLLIVLAARSRSRTATRGGILMQKIKQQFQIQKELYLTPSIIILSSLSHIILSFSFACIELSMWQRHALLITYFLSYAPQVLGFVLFVLPSTTYSNEFRQTKLANTRLFRWLLTKKKPRVNNNQHAIVVQKP